MAKSQSKVTTKSIGKPVQPAPVEPIESSSEKSEYENHPKFDKFKPSKGVNSNGN